MTEPLRRDAIKDLPDDLPGDILKILHDCKIEQDSPQEVALMTQLLPYIVRRDHTVFNHAYKVGRASV
jgi:NADH/NAD ratio-sensing transcriptional regulator Rex